MRHDHATKRNQHEMESVLADSKKIKSTSDEMSKKNTQLQEKLKDLNKQMSQIISAYSTLNTEHDRLLELAQTYESSILDSVRSERANLVDQFNKQRETFEKSFIEQERIIEESLQNQDRLIATAKADRMRGKGTIDKLRSEFQQLRAAAAERERTIHAEELAASRKMKRTARKGDSRSTTSSASTSESRHLHPSQSHSHSPQRPGESRHLHPSQSHSHSPQRQSHPSPSNSTTNGHLVRLLDERAAAQSMPRRRDLGVSHSSSGTESNAQHQYYKPHDNYAGDGKQSHPSPIRRDLLPGQVGRGGGGVPITNSASTTSMYPGRGPTVGSGGDYSLDQYSHDGSESSSSRYSESTSQYSREDRRTPNNETPPARSSENEQHRHPHQHHSWRHHEYGKISNT